MEIDNRHIEDDNLEKYSMRSLPKNMAEQVELHLLTCGICRDRLVEAEDYIASMKDAARGLAKPEPAKKPRPWSFPRLIPAFAALALLTIAAVLIPVARHNPAAPFAVSLQTMRGPSDLPLAPTRRPLLLELDLTGLTPSPSYGIEVVDRSGDRVWQSAFNSRGSTAAVAVPPQNHGIYFVRVALPSGETLREYGLEVRGTD